MKHSDNKAETQISQFSAIFEGYSVTDVSSRTINSFAARCVGVSKVPAVQYMPYYEQLGSY